MKISLIVPETDWKALMGHLLKDQEERMAFGFCGVSKTARIRQYLLRRLDLAREDEYRFQGAAGVSLRAENVVGRLMEARCHQGFMDAHSHPFSRHPRPSATDQEGARVQYKVLRDLAPGVDLLRIIVGSGETVWAEVAVDGQELCWSGIDEIVVLGRHARRVIIPVNAGRIRSDNHDDHDRRTAAVIGEEMAQFMRSFHVAVIGVGGVGSAVVAQIRGYIGHLTIVDPDIVTDHNAPRLYHYKAGDEGLPKVLIHERGIHEAFPGVEIRAIQEEFPGEKSLEALKDADIWLCCPDHNAVRYAVSRAAARYMKPVIEVGCGGKRSPEGKIVALGYHVRLQVPGGICLACNGLDLRDLEDPESTAKKRDAGYVEGGEDLIQGELMPLTTRAASDAVDMLFRYVTGFIDQTPGHIYFDALRLKVVDLSESYTPEPGCSICGESLAGSPSGAGDHLTDDQQILACGGRKKWENC